MDWEDRVSRRLKPRDLSIFMTVAEDRNMAKAADRLAISRPVVSKTIASLEHTLGVPLFDRSPQGVEPTRYGRALFKRSVAILDELRQSVKEIEFLADPTAGELRVGSNETISGGLVSAAIDRLSRRHSQLAFHLEVGTMQTLQYHFLRERKCEIVIGRPWSAAPEPDMDMKPLFQERLFVVAGPRNKWAGRRKLVLADLLDEPWILSQAETEPGSPLVAAFAAIGSSIPRATIVCGSLNLRNSLLATGRYLTSIPSSVLHFAPRGTPYKVLPIVLPPWRSRVSIISLKNRTLSPMAHLFIDCIGELSKPLANSR
jgi:DNA-binding transcriptional LysR family regulator